MIKKYSKVFSWSLYDLANQFFALNIVSLHFPKWLVIEKGSPELFYGLSYGASMLLVAVTAPFLGTISDVAGKRNIFLVFFTMLSVVFVLALALPVNIFIVLVFFAIANFGCQQAIVFYNALLSDVAPQGNIGIVSGLGRMFGYIGAIVALYLTKPVILNYGYRPAFLLTGGAFFVFALPCMLFVRATNIKQVKARTLLTKKYAAEVIGRIRFNFLENTTFNVLVNFLKAAFFVLCAVNTMLLFMGIYATKVFYLSVSEVTSLIAISAGFAIIGAIAAGFISDLIGCRKSLLSIFILWAVCILAGTFSRPPYHWIVGGLAGLSLGGIWVILRAIVVKIIPKEHIGEAFGLFNLVCYFAGIVGPLCFGIILLFLARYGAIGYRFSLGFLIVFVVIGIFYLLKIKEGKI